MRLPLAITLAGALAILGCSPKGPDFSMPDADVVDPGCLFDAGMCMVSGPPGGGMGDGGGSQDGGYDGGPGDAGYFLLDGMEVCPTADGGPALPTATCNFDTDGSATESSATPTLLIVEVYPSCPQFVQVFNASLNDIPAGTFTLVTSLINPNTGTGFQISIPEIPSHAYAYVVPPAVMGTSGEMALQQGATMTDYVCWIPEGAGATSFQSSLMDTAHSLGIWQVEMCVTNDPGDSIHMTSSDPTSFTSWTREAPTPLGCGL